MATVDLPSTDRLARVRSYIKQGWRHLTRSHADLPAALRDDKVPHVEGTPWALYVSSSEDPRTVAAVLERSLTAAQIEGIRIARLPGLRLGPAGGVEPHGLLYLPHPYVVPGGRFNEMYGWDSYFILLGLLRDGERDLARNMVDNFLFEIEHYGMILNANRSYYLTRSQPPFLTSMILGVFERTGDRDWLRGTLPAIEKFYRYWTSPPHEIDGVGLSRYHALGEGPAPEVVAGETDSAGLTHYERVKHAYRADPPTQYDLSLYYNSATDQLTPLFYIGDRSMRESGFDPSDRFGPFSVDIIHYAPVCLNSLLYRMETETAAILTILGDEENAEPWRQGAAARRTRINDHLWDESEGLYMDYHFPNRRLSDYPFATTFYPLWAGIATEGQARRVVENLPRFEARCGLLTSTTRSGSQWDAPYGWAPLQLIAVEGLRRYGYDAQADRLAGAFIHVVVKEFEEHGAIFEKYDVIRCESDIAAGIRFGYASNEIGFGWTNGVFLELLSGL
ncbi:MAG: trehalase family glycosidase [Acidobacteria bacterium]|nr:trehalase family glycosidase [Acidobacteriota bacterium]